MGMLETFGDDRTTIGEVDARDRAIHLSGPARSTARRISGTAFHAVLGVFCLWLFAYISGLFPYLGMAGDNNRSGPASSTSVGKYSFGPATMLLFKGQRAFIEYDSTSPEGEISLDVKPFATLGFSERRIRVKGKAAGTLEVPIASTGLYSFRHEPALGRGFVHTEYSVSWGAR